MPVRFASSTSRARDPFVAQLRFEKDRDLPPLEPRLAMRGMYKYFADSGRFTECLTRKNLPVAMEQDNAALESAYSKARRQPGEELLVNLEGRVALRPRMEGQGQQPLSWSSGSLESGPEKLAGRDLPRSRWKTPTGS